jgi:dephospho-CoA kinase
VYLIGLTGGIASGKTTVAKRLVELGAVEIDADVLARQAVERGSAGLAQIQDRWGSSLVTEEGELDRAALAKIVFADPEERHQLESIVHPIVRTLAREALEHQDADAIVVYTVPLLVEAKVDLPFDLVVTVEAPETQQIERMIKHRGMTADEALARIGNQATAAQRANHADIILNSNQSLGRLIDDVDNLWAEIVSRSAAKQGS